MEVANDVLLVPQWVKSVNSVDRTVAVDPTRDVSKQVPWFDPTPLLSREVEIAASEDDGRTGYWPDAAPAAGRVWSGLAHD